MKTLSLIFASLFIGNWALAQERSASGREAVESMQEETILKNDLEAMKAQLQAMTKETQRRMACQQATRVSTATGCVDIPGLEGLVAARRNAQNAAVQPNITNPPPVVDPCVANPYAPGCVQLPAYCADNPNYAGCPGCPAQMAMGFGCIDPTTSNMGSPGN
jgi:hypothetical protein